MNQQKIGQFIRELRKERELTQEQLAETLGVSGRSVSRWENGVNMPDLDLVIQLADFFEVSMEELFDGEKKEAKMDKGKEDAMLKVSEYENEQKMRTTRILRGFFVIGIIANLLRMFITSQGLIDRPVMENLAGFLDGFQFSIFILGLFYTSKYMSRIQSFKERLLKREA